MKDRTPLGFAIPIGVADKVERHTPLIQRPYFYVPEDATVALYPEFGGHTFSGATWAESSGNFSLWPSEFQAFVDPELHTSADTLSPAEWTAYVEYFASQGGRSGIAELRRSQPVVPEWRNSDPVHIQRQAFERRARELMLHGYSKEGAWGHVLLFGDGQGPGLVQLSWNVVESVGAARAARGTPVTARTPNVASTSGLAMPRPSQLGIITELSVVAGPTRFVDAWSQRHVSITSRLLEHLQQAVKQAKLTPRQARDVMARGRGSSHWGTQIDSRFKELVQNDPLLCGEVVVSSPVRVNILVTPCV